MSLFRQKTPPLILAPLRKEVELCFLLAVADILNHGYSAAQPMIVVRVHELGISRHLINELTKQFFDAGYIMCKDRRKARDTWRSWVIARDPGFYAEDIELTSTGKEILHNVLQQNNPARIRALCQRMHIQDLSFPAPRHI
jgi:hypothetical protein